MLQPSQSHGGSLTLLLSVFHKCLFGSSGHLVLLKILHSPYLKYSWVFLDCLSHLLPQVIFVHIFKWSRNCVSGIHFYPPPHPSIPCPAWLAFADRRHSLHLPWTINLQGNSYNSQPCIYLWLWVFISPVLKYHNISAVNWSTLASWVIFIVNLRWHVIVQINGSCESEILSLVMVITFNMC